MSTVEASLIDSSSLSKFHIKTSIAAAAGMFCDGYLLGIIAPSLPIFIKQFPISPLMQGLVGASTLIGVLLGALIFGRLTDKYGRKKLFILDLLIILIASLFNFFITDVIHLLILRFIIGLAVGGDHAIAPTVIGEFAPKKQRATLLSLLTVMWVIGYVCSFLIGLLITEASFGATAWKWLLMSSSVPALIVLLLRWNTPESPRWLASQGRSDEALSVLKTYVNSNAKLEDVLVDQTSNDGGFKEVFSSKYRNRLFFMCSIWLAQVIPYFAVFTFLPKILEGLKLGNSVTGTLTIDLFLLLGSIAGLYFINKVGRRTFAITCYTILTVSTLLIGFGTGMPFFFILLCFSLFAFTSTAISPIDVIYPTELFPTEIRATATGLCVSISRIGAAIGTFLLPIGMTMWSTNIIIIIAGLISAYGLIISILMAPETRNLTLNEASRAE